MKLLLLLAVPVLGFVAWWETTPKNADLAVTDRVIVRQVTRFGVNLGGWTSWGAEQLSSNVIKNPGFEGVIDRAIAIPDRSGEGSFDDSPNWLARADGFWDGAHYDIRTGLTAGKGGTVARSTQSSLFGLPSFVVKDGSETPPAGEAISLTKETVDAVPTQWWFGGSPVNYSPAIGEVRPGSPGSRSLRITGMAASDVQAASYLDAIGPRAGKLLPLAGEWSLSFWTRLERGKGTLRVSFGRDSSSPILQQNVPLTESWRNVQIKLSGSDEGPPGNVSLRFQVGGEPVAQVLLDDVDLRRTQDANFPFRHEVVALLDEIHPKYLRDWQGQLGDTLANRIASPFARKAYRYRPGNESTDYGYGLRDFLDLCLKVGADPWIIVPTTFSDDECSGLGDYLAAQSDTRNFHDIVLEYGNENWNLLFRPAGIPDARIHGQAAGRCLANIKKHSGKLPIHLTINAQHANPVAAASFAEETKQAGMEAVAPYFLPDLDANISLLDGLRALFAGDQGRMKTIASKLCDLHKELAVYEVNLTTNGGTASGEQRMPVVAGAASGTALAKTMLDALQYGVKRQCVYNLAQFDTQLPKDEGFVRIWGIARDLGPTRRLRPTGLALQLLNRTLGGDMYEVGGRGPKSVSAYAFQSKNGWAVALISASDKPQQVDLKFPDGTGAGLPQKRFSLASDSWEATNENSESIRIASKEMQVEAHKLSLELAPWEFSVLLPAGGVQ